MGYRAGTIDGGEEFLSRKIRWASTFCRKELGGKEIFFEEKREALLMLLTSSKF